MLYSIEYTSAVQPSIYQFPKASSNYNTLSAIELWLSVPQLLEVWFFRSIKYLSVILYMGGMQLTQLHARPIR